MTTSHNAFRNIAALGRKVLTGQFTQGPAKRPANVVKGGTGGSRGLTNNYGSSRGQPLIFGPDGRQWVAPGAGTSQDRYTTTRLPGDRR